MTAEDRPEDLLLGDLHLVVDVHEDRGLDVVALVEVGRAAAADGEPCPLLLPAAKVALHPVPLPGRHRSDLGRRVQGVAHRLGAHLLHQRGDHLVVAAAGARMRVWAMQACPLFIVVLGNRFGMMVSRSASSRMIAADLPPELQRAALEPLPAEAADALAGRRGPGEGDLVHARVGHEVLAHLAARGHDREHALGQPGLGEDLGQPEGVEGVSGAGL